MKTRKQDTSPDAVRQPAGEKTRNWYRDIPVKDACEKCGEVDPCRICEGENARSERRR
ncbi:MAG: hypothetical protein AB1346_02865 [Thermodesulfobacteriota bacterium]